MASSALRQVVVDSSDSSIKYAGEWGTLPVNTEMNFNWFGPTYNNLLRSTKGDSSLSFTFSGSSIALIGRSNFANISGNILPQFSCSIDGIQIPNESFMPVATNNFVLCDQKPGTLVDGEHHFSLNVTTSPQLFYFDRLEYIPSSGVSLSKATLKVNHTDPAISYSGNWLNYGNYVNMTRTGGSKMTFNFIGKSVTWVSYYPAANEVPQNASLGAYSIDGGNSTTFQMFSGVIGLPTSQFNQVFFKTPDLPPGPHELQVTYEGSAGQMPLSLLFLYVLNDSATSNGPDGPSTTGTAGPTVAEGPPQLSAISPRHRDLLIGGTVGGVMGGILVLATCVIIWLWHKRRQKAGALALEPNSLSILTSRAGSTRDDTRKGGHRYGSVPTGESRSGISRSQQAVGTSSGTRTSRTMPPIQHEDSGLRLNNFSEGDPELAELPPSYTEL